jgi:pyridoxamine 5'-phosphate oxidase
MLSDQKFINSNKKPIELFEEWFDEAKKSEFNDPNAMNLATISSDGKPNSRIVLLKSYDDNGFVFYTNSKSKKGKAIKNNSSVALNFHWKTLQRQIRVEGDVSQISNSEADEYYNSRPLGSKIGAWASLQSEELDDRSTLIKRVEEFKKKFSNNDVPRPSYWNGYLVKPNLIEFWQEMSFRLHDRVEFKKEKENWVSRKLYP